MSPTGPPEQFPEKKPADDQAPDSGHESASEQASQQPSSGPESQPLPILDALPVDPAELYAEALGILYAQPVLNSLDASEPDPRPQARTRPIARPPHPGLLGAFLWFLAYIVVLQLLVPAGVAVVMVGVKILRAPDPMRFLQRMMELEYQKSPEFQDFTNQVTTVSIVVTQLVSVVVVLLIIRLLVGKDWMRRLAIRRPGLVHLFLVILGLPGLLYLTAASYEVSKQFLPTFNAQAGMVKIFAQWSWWFGVLVVGVGPAINEELWFRGFLGRGLVGRWGPFCGILITSLFFGVAHFDPPHIAATMVIGLCLHFAYLMTRSLFVPIALHFLNNSLVVLSVTFMGPGNAHLPSDELSPVVYHGRRILNFLQPLLEPTSKTPPVVYAGAILLLFAVAWALYRSRARLIPTGDSDQLPWQPDFPGVDHPPRGSGSVIARPWPGWLPSLAVLVAGTVFACLAYRQ